jgi:hypothetical protein
MLALRTLAFAFAASTIAVAAHAQDAIVQPGYAVVTGYAGFVEGQPPADADPTDYRTINLQGISAEVADLTTLGAQGTLSTVPKPFSVTAAQVGQVFGVALDDAKQPNIYVAATSAYGLSIFVPDETGNAKRVRVGEPGAQFVPGQWGPAELSGGPGSIYRIDGVSGEVTLLTTVDGGSGAVSGIGALTFDPASDQLFASERGTGIIYRIGLDGAINGTFDHGTEGRPAAGMAPVAQAPASPVNIEDASFDTENPSTWGVTAPARRIWGLGVYNKRLYYAVAQGPQIWSAAINTSTGAISGARFEVDVPAMADGIEIASITFDGSGRMYLAERAGTTGDFTLMQLATEGQSRVLRFVPKPAGDPAPGRWRAAPDVYSVGMPPAYANANGGVALNYGYLDNGKINLKACGATVWSTGERLLDPGDGTEGFPPVEGLQGNSVGLFQPQNMPPTAAWFVDYDDQAGDPALRGYLGALATIPCAGTQPPVQLCPPNTQRVGNQCLPLCPPNTIRQGSKCVPNCPQGQTIRDGKCQPPACPKPTVRYQDGSCGCPNPNDVVTRDGKRCVPPQKPCDLTKNDIVNNQCIPKCPRDWQHTGPNGKCEPPKQPCNPNTSEMYKGQCVPKCDPPMIRQKNGQCGLQILCNLNTHEYFNNQCVPKCLPPNVRQKDGSCKVNIIGPLFPLCDLSTHDKVGDKCLPKCTPPAVRQKDGSCKVNIIGPLFPLCDLSTHDKVGDKCLPKCTPPAVRLKNGACVVIDKPVGPIEVKPFINPLIIPQIKP